MNLKQQINSLRNSELKNTVNTRLNEFKSFSEKSSEEWFSELCFCILTANSKARTAMAIQKELTPKGFLNNSKESIRDTIKNNKHRFHNNKSNFIIEARKFSNIKEIIQKLEKEKGQKEAREFIVKNIKGIGYKEASHFLRNVGYENLAILDRHILNLMLENNYLKEKPKSLNRENYLDIEDKFNELAGEIKMSPAELDLYMWYVKAGEVLK